MPIPATCRPRPGPGGRVPWRRCMAGLPVLLAGLATLPQVAQAQGGSKGPRLRLLDGAVELRPAGLLQLDMGTVFGRTPPGEPDGGFNPRRLRLGLEVEILGDFEANLTWDFGGVPGERSRLYEASLAYGGLDPFTVTVGIFNPHFTLDEAQDAEDLPFLERAAIVEAASGLAAGDRRVAAEIRANGERWLVAAALTGGRPGPGEDSTQRGAVARLAGLPIRRDGLSVHLGISGAWSFRPPRAAEGRSVELSEPPELSLDRDNPTLDTGAIRADSARSGGVALGLSRGPLWVQGEWYGIAVEREGGGTLRFSGWYAQAAWVLLGKPREWSGRSAAWGAPKPERDFNPAAGQWGAVEIGARFSTIDLNDGDIRGGRQQVWSASIGWWPVERFRLLGQYQYGQVRGGETDRSFQALALRAQLSF